MYQDDTLTNQATRPRLYIFYSKHFQLDFAGGNIFTKLYFTHHTIQPLEAYNSMVFSIFTELCDHHQPVLEYLHSLQKEMLCLLALTAQPTAPGSRSSGFCPYGFAYSGYFTQRDS